MCIYIYVCVYYVIIPIDPTTQILTRTAGHSPMPTSASACFILCRYDSLGMVRNLDNAKQPFLRAMGRTELPGLVDGKTPEKWEWLPGVFPVYTLW